MNTHTLFILTTSATIILAFASVGTIIVYRHAILRLYRLATCRHEFRMPPEYIHTTALGPITTNDEYFSINVGGHAEHRLCWRCGRFIATGKEGEK